MKALMNILKAKKGVTLIELLVVVVILGIIAAVAIPAVMGNQEDTYKNTNLQNLKIVQESIARYAIDHGGKYPTSDGSAGSITFNRLTLSTNLAGYSSGSDFGPYLQARPDIFDTTGAVIATTTKFQISTDGIVSLPSGAAK